MKVGKGNSVDPDLGTTSCCSIFLCSQVNGVNREKTQCQETFVPFYTDLQNEEQLSNKELDI